MDIICSVLTSLNWTEKCGLIFKQIEIVCYGREFRIRRTSYVNHQTYDRVTKMRTSSTVNTRTTHHWKQVDSVCTHTPSRFEATDSSNRQIFPTSKQQWREPLAIALLMVSEMRTSSIVNSSTVCQMQKRATWKRNCSQNHSITIAMWTVLCYYFVFSSKLNLNSRCSIMWELKMSTRTSRMCLFMGQVDWRKLSCWSRWNGFTFCALCAEPLRLRMISSLL